LNRKGNVSDEKEILIIGKFSVAAIEFRENDPHQITVSLTFNFDMNL